MSLQSKAQEILKLADVVINGTRDWDIKVHNPKVYSRVFAQGNLGLGESYMEGWWDCDRLDILFDKLVSAKLGKVINPISLIFPLVKSKLINLQTTTRSKLVAEKHYDIGNDLYENMLDKYMQYSCGYWKDASTLEAAQTAKLDLICRKLMLKPGMTVLDIGCGWGGFAKYASEKYKVEVTGITISKEQASYAEKFCKGYPVKIIYSDYRDFVGDFDRVLSIGMFEHVGLKNYKTYMNKTSSLLRDDGISLLHTIGFHKSLKFGEPWYTKYIFPNSFLPSLKQICEAAEGHFKIQDVQNFSSYYDLTMMSWFENFNNSWPEIKKDYDEKFYRMWKYYLLSTAGIWRAGNLNLWQIVITKNEFKQVYISPR